MRPNILFITSDQQHWNTLGLLNGQIKTPNLDRLAREGTCFDRAYTVNPTCTPTRATFMTGKYPSQHGAWCLGTKLKEEEHNVCQDFGANGYRTALIGKAHFHPLQGTEEYPSLESCPILQDLDYWRAHTSGFYNFDTVRLARNHTTQTYVGQHYAIWMEEQGLTNWRDYFSAPTGNLDDTQKYRWRIPEKYHYNAWIADETNKLLEGYQKNNENFFLWASFFDPHPPYFVPEDWVDLYDPDTLSVPAAVQGEHEKSSPLVKLTQEEHPDVSVYQKGDFRLRGLFSHLHDRETLKKQVAVYYSMVTLMDKYIGKILDKLEETGLADNTIIIFTTDHGNLFGQHGLVDKGPFMYEDLLKIPFLVKYKDHIPANRISHALQSVVDLVPTMLDYCGIRIPDGVSGKSQRSVWNGQANTVRDCAVCEYNLERGVVNLRTYVWERYKMTLYMNWTFGELYDLWQDPDELNNLWDMPEYRERKTELLQKCLDAEMDREPNFMPKVAGA